MESIETAKFPFSIELPLASRRDKQSTQKKNIGNTYIQLLCTMPPGQSGHTRIGTFAYRSNPTAHPKQAKEPTFQPTTKK